MLALQGVGFAPGLPPVGAPVRAELDRDGLRLLVDPPLCVPLAALAVEDVLAALKTVGGVS